MPWNEQPQSAFTFVTSPSIAPSNASSCEEKGKLSFIEVHELKVDKSSIMRTFDFRAAHIMRLFKSDCATSDSSPTSGSGRLSPSAGSDIALLFITAHFPPPRRIYLLCARDFLARWAAAEKSSIKVPAHRRVIRKKGKESFRVRAIVRVGWQM